MGKTEFIAKCKQVVADLQNTQTGLHGRHQLKTLELIFATEFVEDSGCCEAIKEAWDAERKYFVASMAY